MSEEANHKPSDQMNPLHFIQEIAEKDAEADSQIQEAEQLSDEEISYWIEIICKSKADEFHLLGYEHVQPEEIWECVSDKYRGKLPALHRIVGDIMSLKVTQFMNWMTLSIYKQD